MDGVALRLMEEYWKEDKGDSYENRCYLGDDTCGFQAMIDWMENGDGKDYKLIFLGAIMETPSRRSGSSQASASIVDDELAIVKRDVKNRESGGIIHAFVLMDPFDKGVWVAAILTLTSIVCAAVLLKFSKPFAREGQRKEAGGGVLKKVFDGMDTISRALIMVFGIGSWDEEQDNCAAEDNAERGPHASSLLTVDEHGDKRMSWRWGVHKLVKLLLSLTIAMYFIIWVLFYNAALTNFLFQGNQGSTDRAVNKLTDVELRNYTILKDSGAEEAWSEIQEENTGTYSPWKTCLNFEECFDVVIKSEFRFLIVQKSIALNKAINDRLCNDLTIFVPEEHLYTFNAGFLYGSNVSPPVKKDIDYQLLTARIQDKIRKTNEIFSPKSEECIKDPGASINWRVIIVPTSIVLSIFLLIIIVEISLIISMTAYKAPSSS